MEQKNTQPRFKGWCHRFSLLTALKARINRPIGQLARATIARVRSNLQRIFRPSGDVKTLATALTEAGLRDVKIVVKNENVMINAAKVATVDIEARNGVIHLIGSVIMPPAGKKMAPKGEKKY